MVAVVVLKGGPGSGFHGHKGRLGEVGGSVSEGSDSSIPKTLYHVTKFENAENILIHDYFRTAGGSIGIRGLSTTSSPEYFWGSSDVRFVINSSNVPKLIKLRKVQEEIYASNNTLLDEHEVRLLSDVPIMNAHKIISKIEYSNNAPQSFIDSIKEYSSRFGIPIEEKQLSPITVVLKQLPITEKDKQKLLDLRISIFYDTSDKLSEQVFSGELTIGAWEEKMRAELRQLHSSAAAIVKGGWDQMSSADWGRLGTPLREQYKYLHGFANTIAEQADTISLKAIQARARMYGRAAGGTASIIQAGAVIENLLPWMPRDGSTKCLINCMCRWELKVTKVDKKSGDITIKAVWRLSPAEHCKDCIERNGHVEMLVVPKDTIVPKYIGRGV